MKKRFFTTLAIFLISGLSLTITSAKSSSKNIKPDQVVVQLGETKYHTKTIKIYKYTYNGHRYQFHYISGGWDGIGSAIHDPDCPCHYKRH